MSPFKLTRPCSGCPFATGPKAVRFLGRARAIEIRDSLLRGESFHCHKTVNYERYDEDGMEIADTRKSEHCAGAMILLERIDQPNQMMRIAERVGLYDMTKLDKDYPDMVTDFDHFIDHQEVHCERRRTEIRGAEAEGLGPEDEPRPSADAAPAGGDISPHG